MDPQTVTWVLAGGGTLVNLAWNFLNYKKTSGLQKSIRADTIKLEEFRRVRAPIDNVVSEIRELKSNILAAKDSGNDVKNLRASLIEYHRKLVEAYLKLSAALDAANKSMFVNGQDWLQLIDQSWELYNASFDGIQNQQQTDAYCREKIRDAGLHLDAICISVQDRLDQTLQAYLPK